MKMFLLMGDLTSQDQTLEQKVAYKQRIVFATMKSLIPNWEEPSDWDEISLEEKLERLTKIEETI